ncbi:MAG: radical SAM protein [bacterium]
MLEIFSRGSLFAGSITRCVRCGRRSSLIARTLGFCADCIRDHFDELRDRIEAVHRATREEFELPANPPRDGAGVECRVCVNQCKIPPRGKGYCGIRGNRDGKLTGGTPGGGNLSWYYDPLPTNCVASWVCPAGTGAGYPKFAHNPGPEYGYKNLAVFYIGCSFNCLFCQNWHYRQQVHREGRTTAAELASKVDSRTSCICYFGGDPTPHLPHALRASRLALEANEGRILRVCWETNGAMNPAYLNEMAELSLASGGCIKFDIKAWRDEVHIALTGVTNERTLGNFESLAKWVIKERPDPPPLIASTLLVPGYVDELEVRGIARFLASLDPDIPYSLLAFHPNFYIENLPTTSRRHAEICLEAAREEGLRRVHIGNIHLLSDSY